MIKTYTYKIKPNKAVEQRFIQWCGISRYVYNLGIEVKEEAYKKGVVISHFQLSKQLTEAKKEFEWLREISSITLQATLERLDNAYQKFFKDLKKGTGSNKPHWAKKDKWRSLPFKQANLQLNLPSLRFEPDGKFTLPKFGKIKLFKSKPPKGEIRTATIGTSFKPFGRGKETKTEINETTRRLPQRITSNL